MTISTSAPKFRKYAAVFLFLIFFVFAIRLAVSPEPSLSTDMNNQRIEDNSKVFLAKINPDRLGPKVAKGLFGTNLEWFNNANSIIDDNGNIDEAWHSIVKEQGVDNIRFPGGTLSDFYRWRDGIGPISKRKVTEHPTDIGSSRHIMGTPEFYKFCKATGTHPLITVNVGTAEAQEAAEWVAYCNQEGHQQRIADGLYAPLDIKLWEIGNEVYLPGNPGDDKIITLTPEVYAEKFLKFSKAMRAVDPTIKLMGIGTANATKLNLPHPDWSEVVLSKAASEMDYFAVHNSYFPMLFKPKGMSTRIVYESLWAAPEAVDRSLNELDKLIAKYEKDRHVEIAITEWGSLFSFERDWVDHVKTQGSAVYLARLMQVFLVQPRVTYANYFKLTDRTFMGWVGHNKVPKVPYFVIQLFSKHFGSQLVESFIDSYYYNTSDLGIMMAEENVAELTSVASLNEIGDRLFVNIVSRSWDKAHRVRFDTGSFKAKKQAKAWVIAAPGVTDHNGSDIPAELSFKFKEPELSDNAKAFIGIKTYQIDASVPMIIPPHSIVTVEFERMMGD